MWSKHNFINIIWLLLLLQLVAAHTVLHRRTEIDSNGERHTKTWTTEEADEDFPTLDDTGDEGYQTFTRNGITLRIKPQVTTLRIGGRNISPEQLLEQAKHAKELELLAVRQLLSTRHPVKRTNIENGRKHTSTYTLQPDGSILCRKVEDIDMEDVERRFEEILKQQRAQQHNPNKLDDWEWAGQDKPIAEAPVSPQQPAQANKPNPQPGNPNTAYQPTVPQGRPIWQTPSFAKRPKSATDDLFDEEPTLSHYPKLPSTWDSDSWDKDDPFNPAELPAMGGYDDNFEFDFDEPETPAGQTSTFTNTHTDNDGNIVHTSYSTGPNEWKHKTVTVSKNFQPTEQTTVRTQTLPSLEDFLKSQYNPSRDSKPQSTPPNLSTSTTPTTVKTIKIEDLPPVAVLNINKPLDEQFLYPLQSNGSDQKPIKTLKVENIPPSTDLDDQLVERTKVRTFTKTVHSNQAPSVGDLDPNMRDVLQRAGINPEEISNTNGQAITKTRVEPDGRIVTTTYRVRPTYGGNGYTPIAPLNPNFDSLFGARNPYNTPNVFSAPLPSKHHSASHFGVDFRPFSAGAPDEAKRTTTPTAVRDREPLEPQDDDEEDTATLNPLLIHPVHATVPDTNRSPIGSSNRGNGRNPIAEFLAKIGISVDDLSAQHGEFVKTIVDDDGRVLTARFVLSAPL
ncbi:uncharacterized protein LOC129247854 [Anastrepha obliqua]|uniref:uncharacterized protein LOC129247854 n=1 Tax=Anastrepha obliqua TaxID=95512 RepID=UPI002409B575|nr:uncharacterized protein LOC129247854 [Anastrepha obliqua]